MAKMDLLSLRAHLTAQQQNSLSATDSSKLSGERERAMSYYMGDMSKDLPAEEGRSSAVSMDVADTVEGLMPQLMEVFTGGDEVVKFEPVGPDDVQAAEQETDYVNHIFMNRNPGFMVLYSIIKDALLQKIGIVKVWWEEHEKIEKETYRDKSDDEFALISAAPDVEVIEHTERDSEQYPGIKVHDVTVQTRRDYSCAKVMPVPPEEFGIDRDARSISDANYCYHKVISSVADLIHDGYDENQVRELPSYRSETNSEELARNSVNEGDFSESAYDDASRMVEVIEHYSRLDYEGDGKPELYRIVTGGTSGEILKLDGKPDIAPFDAMPFAALTPVPITHRFFGRAVADLVTDVQKIKTALLRSILDNVYLRVKPRVEISESHAGANTIDDLLNVRAGGIVRTKQPGGLIPIEIPDVATGTFPVLEYYDNVREWRTGVTRAGQGIDANALQNQSATAVNQLYTAAQARVRLIARIFAETGIRDLFSLLHSTIKKHANQAATVRLRNQWVTVDPRNWKTRDDLTVHVGLGSGDKAQQLAQTQLLVGAQEKAVSAGLVSKKNLWNSAQRLSKLVGEKNPETFFTDPGKQPDQNDPAAAPIQPPPDPKIQAIQVQAQLKQQEDQRKAQIEAVQAQADIQTQRDKTQAEMVQSEREFQLKKELAILEFNLQRDLKMSEEARKEREHQQKLEQSHIEHSQKLTVAAQAHSQKMEQSRDPSGA